MVIHKHFAIVVWRIPSEIIHDEFKLNLWVIDWLIATCGCVMGTCCYSLIDVMVTFTVTCVIMGGFRVNPYENVRLWFFFLIFEKKKVWFFRAIFKIFIFLDEIGEGGRTCFTSLPSLKLFFLLGNSRWYVSVSKW